MSEGGQKYFQAARGVGDMLKKAFAARDFSSSQIQGADLAADLEPDGLGLKNYGGSKKSVLDQLMQSGDVKSILGTNSAPVNDAVQQREKEKEKNDHVWRLLQLDEEIQRLGDDLDRLAEHYRALAERYREQERAALQRMEEISERMESLAELRKELIAFDEEYKRTGKLDKEKAKELLARADMLVEDNSTEKTLAMKIRQAIQSTGDELQACGQQYDAEAAEAKAFRSKAEEADKIAEEILKRKADAEASCQSREELRAEFQNIYAEYEGKIPEVLENMSDEKKKIVLQDSYYKQTDLDSKVELVDQKPLENNPKPAF